MRARSSMASRKGFRDGDIVWAKAFAYTWWPGRIERVKGSSASVSLYGGGRKARWVRVSEIRAFEENYGRMAKMVGVALSDAVGLALKDLARRTALGLVCSCRAPAVEGSWHDQIAGLRRRFDPTEMLGFVLGMATSAWVGKGEVVRAVRMSVQVNAYREHVSICQNGEVDERFCPVALLDFVSNMAVCCFIGGRDTSCDLVALLQLNAYRQFVSFCPIGGYAQTMELAHSFLSEESEDDHHELSDSSSDSEIVVGEWKETEEHFFYDHEEEEDFVVAEEQIQRCKDICVVNREDFSLPDLNEEYESFQDKQVEQVTDCRGSTWENTYVSENLEMQPSSSGMSLEENTETTCNEDISFTGDVNQIADCGTCFKLDEQPLSSLSSCQTKDLCEDTVEIMSANKIALLGEVVAAHGILCDSLEMENLEQPDVNNPNIAFRDRDHVAATVSSYDSSLLQTVPWDSRQLVINRPNTCETHFPIETAEVSLKMQPLSEFNLIVEGRDHFLYGKVEENFVAVEEQIHRCKKMCTINREDFSLLDLDEKYKSLLGKQLEQVTDCGGSTCENTYMSEKLKMQPSPSGTSLEEDTEPTCKEGISCTGDLDQLADRGTCFKFDEPPNSVSSCQRQYLCENMVDIMSSDKIVPPGEGSVDDGILHGGLEMENLEWQYVNDANVEHQEMESTAATISLHESSPLQTVPWVSGQLVIDSPNNCDTRFPIETVEVSCKLQPLSKLNLIVDQPLQNATSLQSAFKKRKFDQSEPHKETTTSSINKTKLCNTHLDEEVTAEKSLLGKTLMKSGFEDAPVPCPNFSRRSCRPKKTEKIKRACGSMTFSDMANWTRFYASPLVRDISKSSGKSSKSSVTDRSSGEHRLLHMKFPKDFNLPSKEELEKKFWKFGSLDRSRTKISFYTGAAQVVFVNHADAVSAYRYVKRKSIFGKANVRFWFDKHESTRKRREHDESSVRVDGHSTSNFKSRHQHPMFYALHISDKKEGCSINNANICEDLSGPMKGHSASHHESCLQSPDAHISNKKEGCSINNVNISKDLSGLMEGHSAKLKNCNMECGRMSLPSFDDSSLNLKSCLKNPDAPKGRNKKHKVRFTLESIF